MLIKDAYRWVIWGYVAWNGCLGILCSLKKVVWHL
jgi:hypothetical protein